MVPCRNRLFALFLDKSIFLKKLLSVIVLIVSVHAASAQHFWQQQVNYQLDVHLNDSANTLDGFAKIRYTNNAPDTLHFLWMHLWANAFKNDRTAYSDQLLENGDTRFYFSAPEQKGYINQLDFRTNDEYIPLEDHPEHQDVVKLLLPQPLAPGATILIATPFHVQLPFDFGDGGYNKQSFDIVHWYPQPAVYDSEGWHVMPLLSQGRGYTHAASFDVNISLPSNYVVVAPGLIDGQEQEWLKQRVDFDFTPTKQRVRMKNGGFKVVRGAQPASAKTVKTLHFSVKQAYGFSWIADKRLKVLQDTVRLSSATVNIGYYYLPGSKADNVESCKNVLRYFDSSFFDYPYKEIAFVRMNNNRPYAGIVQFKKERDVPEMLSRMWFEQFVSPDPREYPWMSNGPARYYALKYQQEKGVTTKRDKIYPLALASAIPTKKDQPINIRATKYTELNYELSTRVKAAAWFQLLNKQTGETEFNQIMKSYGQQWYFRHSSPAALKKIADSISQKSTDSIFKLLSTTGTLTPVPKKKLKVAFMGGNDAEGKRHYIGIAPALGYNYYDQLMLGAIVHNYQFPPGPFKFVLAPLYGTGSRKFNGIGRASYTRYMNSFPASWEVGVDFAKFMYNELSNLENNTTQLGFTKLAPWLQLNIKNKNARSTRESYFRLKYFFVTEENFSFRYDSIEQRMSVGAIGSGRGFGQLKFVTANHRILYPYRGELQFEGSGNFGRATFTGNYFLNYPKGGGLNVRAFAGKFFYFGNRDHTLSQYHLNMTGPNGREDYAYSNYFVGRSQFQGWMSQQVAMLDGGFKVRTDLLGNKIGRTDNWLVALNLNSTLHPKLPVKVFADVGTHGEAWVRESNQPRLLFDAGLQLSLLKNTINVYVPLLYSNVYRDYFQMYTTFWQRVSFSVDLQSINFSKMHTRFRHYGY